MKLIQKNFERARDRFDARFAAEIFYQFFRIFDASFGRKRRRHHHAQKIFRADRFRRERGDERRINAARQTENAFFEIVFPRVIANSENQSLMDRRAFRARDAARVGQCVVDLDRFDKFLERRRLQNNIALRIGDQTRAVEDDAVVAADEIDENDRHFRQPGAVRNHLAAQFYFAFVIRRSVDRDDYFRALLNDFFGRVVVVKPVLPKSFIVPEIFADDDADPVLLSVAGRDLDDSVGIRIGLEITRVVENVVFGQKAFINEFDQFAV